MSCLGVHFALTDEQLGRLLAAGSDQDVLMIVKEEIEVEWDEDWLQETGQTWDAIHRCLSDGTLNLNGSSPLSKCVIGGRQLYHGGDYIISFLNAEETAEVFLAIKDIDQLWLRQKYFALNPVQVDYPLDEDDFETTWSYFEELKQFFQKAAQNRRAVIFTADQ